MNAAKHKRMLFLHAPLVIIAVIVSLLGISTVNAPKVSAAVPPGCYVNVQGEGLRSAVCPDDEKKKAVEERGECFYAFGGGSQGISQFQSRPCAELSTGDAFEQTGTGGADICGDGNNAVNLQINIGCRGRGNPIVDALFAFIRFLSVGVGIVLVTVLVVTGIQYNISRGDPNATKQLWERILNLVLGLAIYLLMYAILNWLIPAGIF